MKLPPGFINPPGPRHEVVTGMLFDEYAKSPGFNPHLVALGNPYRKGRGGWGHPLRLAAKLAGQLEDETNGSFEVGSIYHTLLLEPETFRARYAVVTRQLKGDLTEQANSRKKGGAKWHPRLTEFVQWKADRAQEGLEVVDGDSIETAERMIESLESNPCNAEARDFLAETREGALYEPSLFATWTMRDETVMQFKGRPDVLPRGDYFMDPKTCASAHPEDFAKAAEKFGYYEQAGAYLLLSDLLGLGKKRFAWFAHETEAPYFCKVYWADSAALKWGRVRFVGAVGAVKKAAEGIISSYGNPDMEAHRLDDSPGEVLLPTPWFSKELESFQS